MGGMKSLSTPSDPDMLRPHSQWHRSPTFPSRVPMMDFYVFYRVFTHNFYYRSNRLYHHIRLDYEALPLSLDE